MRLSPTPTIHANVETENVILGEYTEVGQQSTLQNVEMGAYSYCGPNCIFQNAIIGRFANIAASVRIGPTRHPTDRPTQHHFTYRRRLYGFADTDDDRFFDWRAQQRAKIGHDTWLGHASIIMPSVAVGTGSVVGAGAVVTKDVPPYAVAVGVPARIVKYRFDRDTIDALQRIRWWNWSHDTIKQRIEDFSLSIQEFVRKFDSGLDQAEAGRVVSGQAGS